jgi:hypothetical protein
LAVFEAAQAGNPAAARLWKQEYAALEPKLRLRPRKPPALGKKAKQEREAMDAECGTGWEALIGPTNDRPN